LRNLPGLALPIFIRGIALATLRTAGGRTWGSTRQPLWQQFGPAPDLSVAAIRSRGEPTGLSRFEGGFRQVATRYPKTSAGAAEKSPRREPDARFHIVYAV